MKESDATRDFEKQRLRRLDRNLRRDPVGPSGQRLETRSLAMKRTLENPQRSRQSASRIELASGLDAAKARPTARRNDVDLAMPWLDDDRSILRCVDLQRIESQIRQPDREPRLRFDEGRARFPEGGGNRFPDEDVERLESLRHRKWSLSGRSIRRCRADVTRFGRFAVVADFAALSREAVGDVDDSGHCTAT